ncbi:MAG TPA: AAA family ATPase [Pseudomonadales bacterium]
MSTIEKAASRLAARPTSNGSSRPPLVDRAQDLGTLTRTAGTEHVASRDGGAPSPAFAGARFCEIDLHKIRARGFLLPDSGRTQLAHEMRRIKRPLLLNVQKAQALAGTDGAPRNPANLIMITSALPGEGKTFTAINLAMSMAAEVDRRVLLVDADVARGDVSRQLGIPPQRGLSDLLQETGHLYEDAVLTSNIERLSILPAGSSTDHVDELFASEMMQLVVRSLAEADPQRVVIFDASPLLATTEAAVLARQMGQTVVVVEAGRTPQDAVAQAIDQLDGCENVSLVLNKTTGKDTGGYGYGYGYGYGSDGSGERDVKSAPAG